MARIAALLLVTLASAIALTIPGVAAEPDAGTVGGGNPEAAWAGSAAGEPFGALLIGFLAQGGTGGYCEDDPLGFCDTYTLTVDDPGTKLTITAVADVEDDFVALEVIDPDENATYFYAEENNAALEFGDPATGDYVVNVLGSPAEPGEPVAYSASATLEGAAPDPEPTTTATPTPTPSPEPSPAPQPAATEPPPPPPPAAARAAAPAARSLALQPDRRRLARAARFGLRTRVVCRGGCTKVKLRVFVSSLTARNLGLGTHKGDVEIGDAWALHDAEGRRRATVTFRRAARRGLARARKVTLAVEAVVTDPDGTTRTALKRITLRR